VVSGPPKVPTEADRLMLPADWALRSCLSFPSGSPVVETDVRLKSIFAAASAETFGWAGEAAEGRPSLLLSGSQDRAGGGDSNSQQQAGGRKGYAGFLPNATGRGEIRNLPERTPAAAARFTLGVPGTVRGNGLREARLRSGTGRAAAAPGILHGQVLLPLWIACGVSCRIRVREFGPGPP
jgi:hypothetical protein